MTLENYNFSPNSDHFSPESDQKYANLLNRNHKSDQIKDIFSDHFPFKSVSQLILINNSGITLANVSDIIIIARPTIGFCNMLCKSKTALILARQSKALDCLPIDCLPRRPIDISRIFSTRKLASNRSTVTTRALDLSVDRHSILSQLTFLNFWILMEV